MIDNIAELRKAALRSIFLSAPYDYLMRHALGMSWEASTDLPNMAWTDFKKIYINFPAFKTKTQEISSVIDPGDLTEYLFYIISHEILHNLWMHGIRSKGRNQDLWRVACEWAINYELSRMPNGLNWVRNLGLMYPSSIAVKEAGDCTTEGFYDHLLHNQINDDFLKHASCPCDHLHLHPPDAEEVSAEDQLSNVARLPNGPEKADIISYLRNKSRQEARKIPWEMLLLGGLEDAVSQEQTWMRPSRRNELLPGWQHEKLLSFVWVLDVSPSISDEMKQSFVNTLQAGINLYHDAQHRVIFFAERVLSDTVIASGTDLAQMEIPTGYGTCLEGTWKVLDQDAPDYVLVLSDMELDEVPKPKHTEVVWGIIPGNESWQWIPEYGTKVMLPA